MAERRPGRARSLRVRADEPLIGVILREDGQEVVRYFAEEEAANAASTPTSIQRALSLAGAWSDLDWEELETAFERIRHEGQPTPPIEL